MNRGKKYSCHLAEEKFKEEFLSLPKKLYKKNENMCDETVERELIEKRHILSGEFRAYPYVIESEGRVLARFMMIYYDNDENAYIGFFEAENDKAAVKYLFEAANKYALKNGCKKIVGPYNASFWLGYRMKTDEFKHPYCMEPYNKEYYKDLWIENGFLISDIYYSNIIRTPKKKDISKKCMLRLESAKKKGYILKNPNKESFTKNLKEIYHLLIRLYSDFPGFKTISEEKFMKQYQSLKMALNYKMVTLAYKDGELVGFFISIPNYKNLVTGKITLKKLIKILVKKYFCREFVLIYMGVSDKHLGLGGALAEDMKLRLQKKHAKAIGALIHEGKVSGNYHKELVMAKQKYILLNKCVENISKV